MNPGDDIIVTTVAKIELPSISFRICNWKLVYFAVADDDIDPETNKLYDDADTDMIARTFAPSLEECICKLLATTITSIAKGKIEIMA